VDTSRPLFIKVLSKVFWIILNSLNFEVAEPPADQQHEQRLSLVFFNGSTGDMRLRPFTGMIRRLWGDILLPSFSRITATTTRGLCAKSRCLYAIQKTDGFGDIGTVLACVWNLVTDGLFQVPTNKEWREARKFLCMDLKAKANSPARDQHSLTGTTRRETRWNQRAQWRQIWRRCHSWRSHSAACLISICTCAFLWTLRSLPSTFVLPSYRHSREIWPLFFALCQQWLAQEPECPSTSPQYCRVKLILSS
jgi:hypothetical protein